MTRVVTYQTAPATAPLYARALADWAATALARGRRPLRLPDLEVRRRGVSTDDDQLAAYVSLTGGAGPGADRLPGLYPHLAAFAPQLRLITDRRLGASALGLVHLRHAVVQHRPLGVGETYDLTVRPAALRPHRRGRLIELDTAASVRGEAVWAERMTLLARGDGDLGAVDASPLADAAAPAGDTGWAVPADIGRRYAALSGDRNPIHLGRIGARVFGFPRAIAHGMWTAARALAEMQPLPDSFRYDVDFRTPLLLPAEVRFGSGPAVAPAEGGRLLGVVSADGSRQHLVARLRQP